MANATLLHHQPTSAQPRAAARRMNLRQLERLPALLDLGRAAHIAEIVSREDPQAPVVALALSLLAKPGRALVQDVRGSADYACACGVVGQRLAAALGRLRHLVMLLEEADSRIEAALDGREQRDALPPGGAL